MQMLRGRASAKTRGSASPQNHLLFQCYREEICWAGEVSGDPYGTRSRSNSFAALRVDSPKRLNQSVLIRRTNEK